MFPEGGHHSRAGHRKGIDLEMGGESWKVALGWQKRHCSLAGSMKNHYSY